MAKINCVWCNCDYSAFSENRRHCKKPACRNREIEENINDLSGLIALILRHRIKADIEIRLPGNDTIGKQAKLNSLGNIDELIRREPINNANVKGQLLKVKKYFSALLWKNIKGNFIVKTNEEAVVEDMIFQETFITIKNPVILGNNKIIRSVTKFT